MNLNGDYLTVEEYRKAVGFTSRQPLYRAIRQGRLEHVIRGRTILIPRHAVIIDKRIKSGVYIGLRQWIDRQISNAKDMPEIVDKMHGVSTRRKKDTDYVDNDWEEMYNNDYHNKGVR